MCYTVFLLYFDQVQCEIKNSALELDNVLKISSFSTDLTQKDGLSLMKNLTWVLNKTLEDYDKALRPDFFGPPLEVNLTFHIEGIPHISEVDMEIKVDFYLRQQWIDHRLKFEFPEHLEYIPLTEDFGSRIWFPDTFFQNEKDSFVHSATVNNVFFRWYPNGRILMSRRMTLTASCPMDLTNFPMDYQECGIHTSSYGLADHVVKYDWESERSSIHFGPYSLALLQNFRLVGYRQRKTVEEFSTGNYTTLICEFLLSRAISYYLIEVYIPSALVVIISWFAFWMGREASSERMALGVTSVLTITTLLLSTHSNSPKISYIKAIDVYAGVCFVMVFTSMLQSALIGYLLKKAKRYDERCNKYNAEQPVVNGQGNRDSLSIESTILTTPPSVSRVFDGPYEMTTVGRENQPKKEIAVAQKAITKCDVWSRVIFPGIFAIFNGVYWFYYLNASAPKNTSAWVTIIKAFHNTRW